MYVKELEMNSKTERPDISMWYLESIALLYLAIQKGLPCGSDGKESACSEGDLVSIPGLGKSPGEGNGDPLQLILAQRIPWTEEPGGLQSIGSQRIGND